MSKRVFETGEALRASSLRYKDEVKLALKFSSKSQERKQQFAKLRKMGNFNHNMQVLESKKAN